MCFHWLTNRKWLKIWFCRGFFCNKKKILSFLVIILNCTHNCVVNSKSDISTIFRSHKAFTGMTNYTNYTNYTYILKISTHSINGHASIVMTLLPRKTHAISMNLVTVSKNMLVYNARNDFIGWDYLEIIWGFTRRRDSAGAPIVLKLSLKIERCWLTRKHITKYSYAHIVSISFVANHKWINISKVIMAQGGLHHVVCM